MRNRLLGSAVVVVILAVLLNLTGCRAETDQTGNAVSTPDISGVWMQRTLGDTFTEGRSPNAALGAGENEGKRRG